MLELYYYYSNIMFYIDQVKNIKFSFKKCIY